MNLDDPKLTAYALNELDDTERAAVAREVNASPQAQREIEETQTMARLLCTAFAADLKHGADVTKPLSANLSDIHDDPWFWTIARPLTIAASLAALAIVGAIMLATHKSGNSTAMSPHPSVRELEVEATAGNQPPAEFAGPDRIASPWSATIVRGIERVVIGELDSDPQVENAEVRVLETINDPYRVEHIKQRLGIPFFSKTSSDAPTGPSYQLMFLDHSDRVLACARFYHAGGGFVLQPEKSAYRKNGRYFIGSGTVLPGNWQSGIDYRAYVIQFPDWRECVGYAPSA